MTREVVVAANAPKAVGPYSQAIALDNLVFTAGQIPLIPETGEIIEGDTATQARQVLTNLKAVLEAAGSSLDLVVKTTMFLVDLNDFAAVNQVYAEFFTKEFPARSTIQIAALPKGARVEIEAIALRK